MDNIKIGNYIKNKRKELHLTQGDLAVKLDVSHQAVSRWEKGDNLPDVVKLSELSVLFKVTIDEIIHNDRDNEAIDEVIKASSLSFYTLVNGVFSSIALVLFYILLFTTHTLWIPILAQYIIVLGISFIYIIPYAMVSDKTINDFKQVRKSILISIGSLMLSASSFFLPYFEYGLFFGYFIIGLIVTCTLLYVLNRVLLHYEHNTFKTSSTEDSLTYKTDEKLNQILTCVAFLMISFTILASTGFITDMFYTYSDSVSYDRFFSRPFASILIIFTILSISTIFLKLRNQKNIINIFLIIAYIGTTIFYIVYNSYTNIELSESTGNMVNDMLVFYGMSLLMIYLLTSITEIYIYIKDKENFKKNSSITFILIICITLFALIQLISTGSSTFSHSDYGYSTTIHNVFQQSLIPLTVYLAVVMYITYDHLQTSKKGNHLN